MPLEVACQIAPPSGVRRFAAGGAWFATRGGPERPSVRPNPETATRPTSTTQRRSARILGDSVPIFYRCGKWGRSTASLRPSGAGRRPGGEAGASAPSVRRTFICRTRLARRPMSEAAVSTPLMDQYEGVKAQYPGHLVLIRVGDFYESFGDDAKLLAKELEITLTAR